MTIDPDDAKDFDDAICLERHGANNGRRGCHIADVSHYVRSGTAPGRRRPRKRGNSTYLVDRVIPMLPEALSNEIVFIEAGRGPADEVRGVFAVRGWPGVDAKFYPAVIHSKRRFTYKEAFAIIQKAQPADGSKRCCRTPMRSARRVRKARFKAGSLEPGIY